MRLAEKAVNPVLFHATNDRMVFATGYRGGVAGFRLKVWHSHIPLSDSFFCAYPL